MDDRSRVRGGPGSGAGSRRAVVAGLALAAAAIVAGPVGRAAAQEALTLEAAVEEALARNAELRVAESRGRLAAAEARRASAFVFPRLDLETGYTRSVDPVFAFGTKLRQGSFSESDFAIEALNDPDPIGDWASAATARWGIASPTAWASRAAASSESRAAGWGRERTREATVLQTEMLYRVAQRGGARREAAAAAEEAAAATRDLFARRVEQGLLTRADLLQADAELASARARRIRAERAERDALRDLALFLGREADPLPALADRLEPSRAAIADAAPPGAGVAPADFDPARRADLRALASRREAADAASRGARLAWLPELGAFARWSMHGADPFAGDGTDWTVGVALQWTAFGGFSRVAEAKRADAARAIARTEYERALRYARGEVARARAGVEAAAAARDAALAARDASEAGADLMRRRFEESLATASDLLAAEARRAAARGAAIDAWAEWLLARAHLRFVTLQHRGETP